MEIDRGARLHGSTSTLSSTSSRESLRSKFSSLSKKSFSKSSLSLKSPVEFWAQFDRKSPQKKSLGGILKKVLFTKIKKEVEENIYELPEDDEEEDDMEETSFSEDYGLQTYPSGLIV